MPNPNHWNTLACADLARTEAFYQALGFTVNPGPPGVPCLTVHPNEHITICIFAAEAFPSMIFGEPVDAHRGQELVQSLGYDSREGVDTVVAAARKAGSPQVRDAAEMPFGYVGSFSDPDGHVWAALWMPA
jgi:predicted lactoylglutathione lyase